MVLSIDKEMHSQEKRGIIHIILSKYIIKRYIQYIYMYSLEYI